jgi:hypothetical protein
LEGTSFINEISDDFSIALGENKTLEYLNVSRSNQTSSLNTQLKRLCKGIAFNAMKNGSLSHVIARNCLCFNTYDAWQSVYESFALSEKDHEVAYGEQKVAAEMKNE